MPTIAAADLTALAGAVLLAAAGGEAFLKGVLGVAGWLRVPKLLVATTLAAFATSSPELTVSIVAALSGKPEIGLGDALGSNVVNIALILGLALLFGPLLLARSELGRDFILALIVPILTLLMALDGTLSRLEGAALLTLFAGWMGLVIHAGRRERSETPAIYTPRFGMAMLYGVAGLAALILAGRLFVTGASGIVAAFGVHPYVIGAVVVAVGTSLPELVTVLVSRLRGHDEVGVGTLLGSNLFNGLAIVGVAAAIRPIDSPAMKLAPAIGFGLLAVLLMLPGRRGVLGRGRGVSLLCAYAAFLWSTLAAGGVISPE